MAESKANGVRRTRPRSKSLKIDRQEIFKRVKRFYDDDLTDNSAEREARLQRYAKLRMWSEGKDWPWADASDIGLSDIMTDSLRVQDTLHNAVMSARPPVASHAVGGTDIEKQDNVDKLIDFQVFVEGEGERFIGDYIDAFVNDPSVTVFTPWVKESRETSDLRIFPRIADGILPLDYFQSVITENFPVADPAPAANSDGWDWDLEEAGEDGEKDRFTVKFYTRDDERIEMVTQRSTEVFDGPLPMVLDYDDVIYPKRAANLQIPGPDNPKGATHVILRDFPTIDEIKRLAKRKFYDLITKEELAAIENLSESTTDNEEEKQRDTMQGSGGDDERKGNVKSHNKITRLMCFDMYDIDGDGIDEDVIWWVLLEPKIVIKGSHLTEIYPASPPRRPLAGDESFIPVRGRKAGISLLELLESTHDVMKTTLDQTIDSGTIANAPFFFYRASGSVKPEVIRLWPGEGYPLADPQRDVHFPNIGNQNQAFGINLFTMLSQQEEKLSMVGDLQLGRVPPGRSSALRTSSNMALLQSQGEARPERILRRLFMGLTRVWSQIHGMNQFFLPEEKKIRVAGVLKEGDDPYRTIRPGDIRGRFNFDFTANVFNSSKVALQQSLSTLIATFINPLFIQMGIIDEAGIYRLARDFAKAQGADPDSYLTPPVPGAMKPRIVVEEALHAILEGVAPEGEPAEGTVAHLEGITAFIEGRPPYTPEQIGLLDDSQLGILKGYATALAQKAEQEARQQQLVEAAQQFASGQQGTGGEGGRPPEQPPSTGGNPPVQGGELLDETLPGAGGGAAQ